MLYAQILGVQQVFSEFLAQIDRDFTKCAFAIDKVLEMAIYNLPFLILLLAHLPEVGEEILVLLMTVDKSELAVDDGLLPATADKLSLVNHCSVVVTLGSVLWLGKNINSEELTTAYLTGARIADSRLKVQI